MFTLDPHAFFDEIRRHDVQQIKGYVFDIFRKTFEREPPEGAHWFLVKRVVAYELMKRAGKLETPDLVEAYEEALTYKVEAIKDPKARAIVVALMHVEADVPHIAKNETIGGTQMAAKKKAAKKVAKKTAKKAAPKAKKTTGRVVGKTSGVGVQETWIGIFVTNAKAKKADRMTDVEITAYMKAEFPAKESKVFSQVQGVRNKYNKGGFKVGAPATESVRYDEEGDVTTARGGSPKAAKKASAKKVAKKAPAKKKKVAKKKK